MSRLANSLLLIGTIILLFHFAGLYEGRPSASGFFLDKIGLAEPQNFESSSFWILIAAIGTIAAVGIIGVGVLSRSFDLAFFSGATVPMLLIVPLIVTDLIGIWLILSDLNEFLATMIVGPLLFYFGFTVFDWVRGRDTR